MINKKRLIKLTQKLVSINSENPGGNEREIACFVRDYLVKLGLKTRLVEFKKNRSNVLAVLRQKNARRSLLITPHLDTVPAGKNWKYQPWGAKISAGRLYGLGATDCKGNLAVSLEAINSLVEERNILSYNLVFAATADEESGSGLGLIPLLKERILKPDAAVVLDADDFEIVITQKGLMHLKVRLKGKKAHGAYPWLGVNAIEQVAQIINCLKRYKFDFKKNQYLHYPTVNTGTITGGDKVNVVADWCEFELDFRFLPGMSEKRILKDLKSIIRKFTNKFSIEIQGIQKPYSIPQDHSLVKYLNLSMSKFNIKPRISGSEGATVISFFQDKNIPAIASGFGKEGCAHMADEYVCLDNLYKGALVLEDFLKRFRF